MKKKMMIALLIGFVCAILLMWVGIYFAYTNAYERGVETFTVTLLGLPIYELSKEGTKYIGQSKGIFFLIFCAICMSASALMVIFREKARQK